MAEPPEPELFDKQSIKVQFACVRFKNQTSTEYDIVPIDFVKERIGKNLKDFLPTHDTDFSANTFYYVFCEDFDSPGTQDEDQGLYCKAHVLYLGESESDIKEKICTKRLKFPNKKYCETSSSTDLEHRLASSNQKFKIDKKELTDRVQKRKKQKAEEELRKFRGSKQLESRPNVVDSGPEDEESEQQIPASKHKTVNKKVSRTEVIANIDDCDGEILDNIDNISLRVAAHKRTYGKQRQDGASTSQTKSNEANFEAGHLDSKKQKRTLKTAGGTVSQQHDVANEINPDVEQWELQDQDPQSQRVSAEERTRYNVEGSWAPTSRKKCSKRNINAAHLTHLTNVPTPERLKKRLQATPKTINTERHGLQRFDIVNGKIYLGLDVFTGKDTWETTLVQKPQTFVRDAATLIWGEEGILNRCFRTDKISVSFAGRSPRKVFEADKLQLLKDLLNYYLEYNQYSDTQKIRHRNSMKAILARYVQDTRKAYKHLVRRQLFSGE